MTTAYAEPPVREPHQHRPMSNLRLVSSAPAQGPEAHKIRENVQAIRSGTQARGYSAESTKLSAAVRSLSESIEALQAIMQSLDDGSYKRPSLRPAFTVLATYKRIGKLQPRRFPTDE